MRLRYAGSVAPRAAPRLHPEAQISHGISTPRVIAATRCPLQGIRSNCTMPTPRRAPGTR